MGHSITAATLALSSYFVFCSAFKDLQNAGRVLMDTKIHSDYTSFLQLSSSSSQSEHRQRVRAPYNLTFMHVPFNFGNTVEKVAMFPEKSTRQDKFFKYVGKIDGEGFGVTAKSMSWDEHETFHETGSVAWGHLHPDLQATSNISGCPLYLTPQKYWPQDLAERYFGNTTVVGILRDPFEKLVAQFRGGFKTYGGDSQYLADCDVNKAIKEQLQNYTNDDMFMDGCTYVPQAEYFDMPYGITVPVDNYLFPKSMNAVFEQYGISNMSIETDDILHVVKCSNSWSGDLDDETRSLIKKIYARDFDLLCKHFGYCDDQDNTCIVGSPKMCPEKLFEWNSEKQVYCPREENANTSHMRVHPACQSPPALVAIETDRSPPALVAVDIVQTPPALVALDIDE